MRGYKHRVRLRADGRYEGRLMIDGRQVSIYGKSEREVRNNIEEIRKGVDRGEVIVKNERLENALTDYLFQVKQSKVKPSTFDRVECTFNNQIKGSPLGRMPMGSIDGKDIQRVLDALCDTLSWSSVKKVYDLCGEFFRYAVATRKLNHNPMVFVTMPHRSRFKKQPKPMSVFTADEVRRIIEAAESVDEKGAPRYRYGEVIVLLLLTGLRSGEVRAIRASDIDLDAKMLYITQNISHSKDREHGGVIDQVSSTKTMQSKRGVPLNERAVLAVERLLKRTYNPDNGYLITTQNGGFLSASYFQAQFDYILKRAGVEHKGLHTNRHSFATILLKDAKSKGQIKEVSELLGHAQVSTTYDYYIHTFNEEKRTLVKSLDTLVKME